MEIKQVYALLKVLYRLFFESFELRHAGSAPPAPQA
jgi:hypothetical protein